MHRRQRHHQDDACQRERPRTRLSSHLFNSLDQFFTRLVGQMMIARRTMGLPDGRGAMNSTATAHVTTLVVGRTSNTNTYSLTHPLKWFDRPTVLRTTTYRPSLAATASTTV